MLKAYAQKSLQEEFLMLYWSIDRTWWKSDSRITKNYNCYEEPITEEGVIEILGTDPAGMKQY
jgi:hypothetical protein